MSIGGVMGIGVQGIQRGMQGLESNASEIARAPVKQQQDEPDNITENLISSLQNKNQVEASAKVVQAASDTLGTIIDISV